MWVKYTDKLTINFDFVARIEIEKQRDVAHLVIVYTDEEKKYINEGTYDEMTAEAERIFKAIEASDSDTVVDVRELVEGDTK